MLRVWIAALASLPALAAADQTPTQLWARQVGTSEYDTVQALAPGNGGSFFATGTTTGDLAGVNLGSQDVFLGRYSGAGAPQWMIQFGTSDYESPAVGGMCSDGVDGVYIAGETTGALGGPVIGLSDGWLARFDGSGNRLWALQIGTTNFDGITGIAPDGSGGVYIVGYTRGSLAATNAGDTDVFIARYDASKTQLWIRQFGTPGADEAWAMTPDSVGGVFFGGLTSGNLGAVHAGSGDAWVARYDASGTRTWIRQYGSMEHDRTRALASDGAGGVFVAGSTQGSLLSPTKGGEDIFLIRVNEFGSSVWSSQIGTTGGEHPISVCLDGMDGLLMTGGAYGNFGGPSIGDYDVFMANFDSAGTQKWVQKLGTTTYDYPSSIITDKASGFYVAGMTEGVIGASSAGAYDGFIVRYGTGCYANCDGSTALPVLNVNDYVCFLNHYAAADPYANCDDSTAAPILNVNDFICFMNNYATGCP